jgi:hypothetical protein
MDCIDTDHRENEKSVGGYTDRLQNDLSSLLLFFKNKERILKMYVIVKMLFLKKWSFVFNLVGLWFFDNQWDVRFRRLRITGLQDCFVNYTVLYINPT